MPRTAPGTRPPSGSPPRLNRRAWLAHAATLAGATGLVPAQALAQSPTSAPLLAKPLRLVVGFPPGGSADLMARALSTQLAGYASSVIVDNKPGAGGRIAIEAVKAAEPDGATALVTPTSMMALYPHIYRRLSYDPVRDFTPVSAMASFHFVLVVGPQVPASVRSVKDFLAWCKAHPAQAAYASPGNGSTPHFAGVALARAAGIELTHAAYKGGAPAMNDVAGGQIAANMAVVSNALPLIHSGKVRALAVTGASRNPALPEVPTLVESGYPEAQVSEWFGVFLPARTPPELAQRLHAGVAEALKTRQVQEVIAKASFEVSGSASPAEFGRFLKRETERWAGIVKAANFTPED